MPDIDYWLGIKYGVQQQQADADTLRAQAGAKLTGVQAGLLPGSTAADIALSRAQAGKLGVETGLLPAESAARIKASNANAGQSWASAGLLGAQTNTANIDNAISTRMMRSGSLADQATRGVYGGSGVMSLDPNDVISRNRQRLGFAKGTARVPGKGSPKKDTVKAKLAPGEAVLNQPAADHLGRGLIAALNKMGAAKMGLA